MTEAQITKKCSGSIFIGHGIFSMRKAQKSSVPFEFNLC